MAKQTFSSGQTLLASQMNSLQANDYNWTVSTQTGNYTLVAADKGTREVMNMASAGTVTVPNATFDAGDIVWVHSIGSGTISVLAGSGMTLNSSVGTAPTLAQWEGGVVYFTSASSSIFFRGGGTGYGVATGGSSSSITVGGVNYTLLTFTSSGTLTVTKAGLFDYLICAGGGAGGSSNATSNIGGGGGAGGIMQGTVYLDANQTVTIGAGGSPSLNITTQGNSSSIGGARGYSVAGGGAGGWRGADRNSPNRGGSGGGGLGNDGGAVGYETGATAMAPSVSGFAGGNGDYQPITSTPGGGGGGGGATAVGGNFSGTTGGAGGAGYDVAAFIAGSALFKCAGGGGAGNATGGTGGSGIGGNGAASGAAGSAAANTGSGGGGARNAAGGSGGSGIIYIRFKV